MAMCEHGRPCGPQEDRQQQVETVISTAGALAPDANPRVAPDAEDDARTASAAGMSSLQRFLEAGFDTFVLDRQRHPAGAERFLATIRDREQQLMHLLFDSDPVACETELRAILGQAR